MNKLCVACIRSDKSAYLSVWNHFVTPKNKTAQNSICLLWKHDAKPSSKGVPNHHVKGARRNAKKEDGVDFGIKKAASRVTQFPNEQAYISACVKHTCSKTRYVLHVRFILPCRMQIEFVDVYNSKAL